jgi:hypothetical protein
MAPGIRPWRIVVSDIAIQQIGGLDEPEKPASSLEVIEDMTTRNIAPAPQTLHVHEVKKSSELFGRSPDHLPMIEGYVGIQSSLNSIMRAAAASALWEISVMPWAS